MSNILAFPVPEKPEPRSGLALMIEQELLDIGADQQMADTIVDRMARFIELASFEFDMEMEVSKECAEEMKVKVVPAILKMEAGIKNAMSELLTERVLHEIELYQLEQQA